MPTQRRAPFQPPPTILIPVFNALQETRACILSVLRETRPPYRLLVLDDASTDQAVVPMLTSLSQEHERLELACYEDNIGFAGNVNRGLEMVHGDVVLLNSDTLTTSGWLDKLVASAYSQSDVATVTPVSNAAGAFSVPENNTVNHLPRGVTVNMAARASSLVAVPRPIETPTGNGFCLYIRRDALDHLGPFDAQAFPYIAEENDFCQRAAKAGFVNLVDTSCYIYHVRSASFGSEELRKQRLAEARKTIDQRYPQYSTRVRAFLEDSQLQAFRSRVGSALENRRVQSEQQRTRVLSVVHAGQGGMIHTNADLMYALRDSFDTYILRCDLKEWKLISGVSGSVLCEWEFSTPWLSTEVTDVARRVAIRSLLQVYEVDLLHVRTLIATGPELLTAVAGTGCRILISFHDFATICPTIQLIDDRSRFCSGHCTPGNGVCRVAKRWFGDMQDLKHSGVYRWRERMGACLALSDGYVTTSQGTKDILVHHFPAIENRNFAIIEHGRDSVEGVDVAVEPGRPLSVVSFGAFNVAKGLDLMRSIYEYNASLGGPVEFHVLGRLPGRKHLDIPHVIFHGAYERDALPQQLRRISPSYAMICSIWPETYCHTLTEAWLCGLPVIASDIGVLSERIARHGGGRLIDPERPDLWMDAFLELGCTSTWRALQAEVRAISLPGISEMAEQYGTFYDRLLQPPL